MVDIKGSKMSAPVGGRHYVVFPLLSCCTWAWSAAGVAGGGAEIGPTFLPARVSSCHTSPGQCLPPSLARRLADWITSSL
jgi:hypothetical protein